MTKKQLLIMSIACGTIVANLYYAQPLLPLIARDFHISESTAGLLPTFTQLGYAFGLITILPLADIREKRKLILTCTLFPILFLCLLLMVKNFTLLLLISFLIGVSSVIPQLLIPLANQLTPVESRGKIVGTLMSGLLAGILLSRILSGIFAEYFGWKSIYLFSIIILIITMILLKNNLPRAQATSSENYFTLLKTIPSIIKKYPSLIKASLIGALAFFTFSAFWTTISMFLESYYHLGSSFAGLLGIIGLSGVLFSSFIGRFSDKKGNQQAISLSAGFIVLSFLVLLFFSNHYIGLILGIVFLDIGVQGVNVSSQSLIHKISETERSRITAIYMTFYFIGGALGSFIGAKIFSEFGWNTLNILCIIVSLGIILLNCLKKKTK